VAGLTKEDLTGDLLYATILGYFAANEASEQVEQRTAEAVAWRKPSFGHFGISAKVAYLYGIPRLVSFPGAMMDVDYYKSIVVMKDNDETKRIAFIRKVGARLSAFENTVPEKIWNDVQPSREGISAVKALAKAASEGQRIYVLTSQNLHLFNQVQIDDLAQTEIRNAISIGKSVTVHERPILVSGWTGSGYIIEDVNTGGGAYKISGGANGSWMSGIFQAISAAALAMTDNLVSNRLDLGRILFSPELQYQQNLARASALVGWAGLGIQVWQIGSDDGLSLEQRLGQISINILVNFITAYIIGQMVTLGLIGALPIIFSALVIGYALSVSASIISTLYFSLLRIRRLVYA
jgi:hypothetical protein